MRVLRIDLLAMDIVDAPGHEHRVQPVAPRAAALFAERLEEGWPIPCPISYTQEVARPGWVG